MRAKRQPWQHRLQKIVALESSFLPKRLLLFTLLLLVIYGVMLIRSAVYARSTNTGLVEARLKSKLIADYTLLDQAAMTFAPLSFALIEAKIRDENPDLPGDEVTSLVETAIAAAAQPIVAATPTPSLRQAGVIQSARVITEPDQVLRLTQPTASAWITTAVASAPVHNNLATASEQLPTALAVAVGFTPTVPEPTAQMAFIGQVASTAMGMPTEEPVVVVPTLSPVATNALATPALPAATSTIVMPITLPTTLTATPQPTATWTPWPSATLLPSAPENAVSTFAATVAATNDAISSGPASTFAAPTATNTALSFVPLESHPTAMPTIVPIVTNTPAPTVTSLPTVIVVPTEVPSPTSLPLPTVTPWPTATVLPIIGTPPSVLNVKARVENDQVYLEWAPIVSPGLVGYNIYRSHSEPVGLGTIINRELLVGTSYVDTIMRDGSKNFYVVTAVNQLQQESVPSIAVTVNMPDLIPPNPPANFALRVTGNVVQIEWQANQEADLAGYKVYRSNSLPVDRTMGPVNGTTLLPQSTYQDTVIQNGQTYYYVFTAVDLAGNESLPSIEAQIPTWRSQMP